MWRSISFNPSTDRPRALQMKKSTQISRAFSSAGLRLRIRQPGAGAKCVALLSSLDPTLNNFETSGNDDDSAESSTSPPPVAVKRVQSPPKQKAGSSASRSPSNPAHPRQPVESPPTKKRHLEEESSPAPRTPPFARPAQGYPGSYPPFLSPDERPTTRTPPIREGARFPRALPPRDSREAYGGAPHGNGIPSIHPYSAPVQFPRSQHSHPYNVPYPSSHQHHPFPSHPPRYFSQASSSQHSPYYAHPPHPLSSGHIRHPLGNFDPVQPLLPPPRQMSPAAEGGVWNHPRPPMRPATSRLIPPTVTITPVESSIRTGDSEEHESVPPDEHIPTSLSRLLGENKSNAKSFDEEPFFN